MPFNANEASNTAEAWCAGTDVPPKTMEVSMNSQKTGQKKQKGLGRLKGGPAQPEAAAAEEQKGGSGGSEEIAELKAKI